MGIRQGVVFLGILLLCFVSSQKTKEPEVYYLHVTSEVDYRFAKTLVTSKVVNKEPVASEAKFDITLPNEAFITAFKLTINGKEIHGKVKEKQQAKQEFEAAKAKGQSGGHIVAKPRETNKFQIQVNVAAKEKVTFELTYRELLRRKHGLYDHVIYVNPGQVVDDLQINILIKESRKITTIRIPPIKDILLTEGHQGTNELAVVDMISPTKAFVLYEPTRAEQKSGISGQFIVQYDVDRSDNAGDILVMDGYFVHFLAPEVMEPMPMDIVFVLDKSGSMRGSRMRQLQESMVKILDDVKPDDKVMIITFDSGLSYWKQEFVQATTSNITLAQVYITITPAGGGTNIDLGLSTGIEKLMKIQGSKGRAPVMVFLTDGEATSGETRTDHILENVKKANKAEIPIFGLAFGRGADFNIVKKVAAQNNGFARKIYEDSDAALQIASFYKEMSTVLLKNVSFNYVDGTLYDTTVTDSNFNTYFKGSEMVVAGKVKDITKLQSGMVVNGTGSRKEKFELRVPPMMCYFPLPPPRPRPPGPWPRPSFPTTTPPVANRNPGMMEKLWAYLTIKQLLKKKGALDSQRERKKLEDKILQLSLKYQFVTELTSMVVTLPDKTKANPSEVDAWDSILKESNMWSFQISGSSVHALIGTPTPPTFASMQKIGPFSPGPHAPIPQSIGHTTLDELLSLPPLSTSPSSRGNTIKRIGPFPPRPHAPTRIPQSIAQLLVAEIPSLRPLRALSKAPSSGGNTMKPRLPSKTPRLPKTSPILSYMLYPGQYTTQSTTPTPQLQPRKLEKSRIPSFGVILPGLTKPICFDLPMVSSKTYSIMKLTSSAEVYQLKGRFGTEMIDKITVIDSRVTTINANINDISKTPIYQKVLDGTTITAANTPLGLQFTAKFDTIKSNLEGILAIFQDYTGTLVDIVMESGKFAAYIDLKPGKGPQESVRGITKEFGEGICWYLDKKIIQHFLYKYVSV